MDSLASLTGVSPITIRRDLADLEGQGLLKRVHGGAVAIDLRGRPLPYSLRSAENAEQKAAIAQVVATIIADDMSVVLDNGSTMVAVAEALVGRPITAMCLSLRTAVALGESDAPTLVTPGGPVTPVSLRCGGAAAVAALDGFRADVAIMGACSASPVHGLTVTTHEDAQIKKSIVQASARVVLAATGDKLVRTSSFRFGTMDDLDDLVTTPDAPESALEEFRAAGVIVHLAV
ncbi:DeoR/GlpR family DNA-binding transcription regulator [Luteococcus sp. Sow4_B9]|uniref:DeoR/GlpR family DNA-binding transcription regulator n=1 Tax=Luteococcus sp. Sow4_B9 TaxID=3438792 RepID=UPI003F995463